MMMEKKYITLIAVAIILASLGVMEYTQGTVSALAFDQMQYTYGSHVIIPPYNDNGSYLGGSYKINGTGRDFKMVLALYGAEKTESPLDYTSDGLRVTGRINTVKATPQTIMYLWQKNVTGAMFNTIFTGDMNMTCAAWTGTSNFQNDGTTFSGTFFINGIYTDWKGNYTLAPDPVSGKMMITADYVYYNKNKTDDIRNLHSVYYI
jgi:hypothetical protein